MLLKLFINYSFLIFLDQTAFLVNFCRHPTKKLKRTWRRRWIWHCGWCSTIPRTGWWRGRRLIRWSSTSSSWTRPPPPPPSFPLTQHQRWEYGGGWVSCYYVPIKSNCFSFFATVHARLCEVFKCIKCVHTSYWSDCISHHGIYIHLREHWCV